MRCDWIPCRSDQSKRSTPSKGALPDGCDEVTCNVTVESFCDPERRLVAGALIDWPSQAVNRPWRWNGADVSLGLKYSWKQIGASSSHVVFKMKINPRNRGPLLRLVQRGTFRWGDGL